MQEYSSRGGLVALCAAATAVWCFVGVSAQQVFRSATHVVTLPVTVTGRGDALVGLLEREHFEVLEDGVPQSLSYFASGATSDVPLHLGILMDTSGSMRQDLASAVTAAIRFINLLEEARDVTFVDFSTRVRVSRFSPGSYPYLFERMRSNEADGFTALYDAVAMYLRSVDEQEGQKVLLLYTDGADSRSSTTFSELVDMLRLSQVMVYVIGYTELHTGIDRATQQMRMNDIARQTGGSAFYPGRKEDVDKAYARILDEINGRYTLGYVSTNTQRDGAFRKVQVKVRGAETDGLKVRSRPGYFAPVR